MRQKFAAFAVVGIALLAGAPASSEILGQNGADITGGYLWHWRLSWSDNRASDAYTYGTVDAAIDGASWSSADLNVTNAVAQYIPLYCQPGTTNFWGMSGGGGVPISGAWASITVPDMAACSA
jgi:hypothetical protein